MKKIVYLLIVCAFAMQLSAQGTYRGYPPARRRANVVVTQQAPRRMPPQRDVYGYKPFNMPGNVYIIPRIGYNMANMTNYDSDSRHGINVGLGLEYMLSFRSSIETGLYYSMQGASYYYNDIGWRRGNKAVIRNDYMNIPLLLKGYMVEGFNIFAGPQLGILVSSNEHLNGYTENMKEDKNNIDLSLVLGVGYVTHSGFSLSMNYNIGLTHVFNASEYYSNEGFDYENIRNGVFQINLGYRF